MGQIRKNQVIVSKRDLLSCLLDYKASEAALYHRLDDGGKEEFIGYTVPDWMRNFEAILCDEEPENE